jgi:protein TIF31
MSLHSHKYSPSRSEIAIADTFGLDLRNGTSRDWNEELQSAREMPKDTIEQRIERARMIHKTLCDFGDAAAAGVVAIFKGQIGPMNPNENVRSHVYLHNNIFFSRAVDSGADTFKLGQGDAFAKKSALRDAGCVGALHKLDIPGMHTLATVLVDYLGVRMVCQSIVPGILLGDKTHQILYGAVESSSPLAWDNEMHEKLEKNLGKSMMIASRKVLRTPLSDDRIEKVAENQNSSEEVATDDLIDYFGSVEMKAIRGSDHRSYCLDLTRLTPRDANWVPHTEGGTGNWERNVVKSSNKVPSNLQDDEWVMSILRPELIMRFTSMKLQEKTASSKKNKENSDENNSPEMKETEDTMSNEVDQDFLDTLRMNLNVFLPHLKTLEHVDKVEFEKIKKDEELAREVATFLWDKVLPEVTKEVKDVPGQIPVDGKSLTDFLHDRGVNCRYLGRLASLAAEEEKNDIQEEKDLIAGKISTIPRRTMPLCWLELLECEMVARAAKHILDKYLMENGGASAAQVSKTVASFLSALMSMSEESAAETERRLEKNSSNNDDRSQLSLFESHVTNSVVRGRNEIWSDIENEVGRRFRYTLRLYNKKDQVAVSRAPLIPLLRRVCQRSGIRLFAKNYSIGGKGLCDANISYPISASDIVEVLPMLRHAANDGRDSFVPFSNGADAANSSLHILLNEAKQAYDAAAVLLKEKNYNLALEYIQEATNLYQRVTDSPLHSRVSKCLDLTTLILYQAKEYEMSANHASKALAVSMQISGFDSADVVSAHMILSHVTLQSGRLATSIKHHRSILYLTELLAGPHHTELSTMYHKFSGIYNDVGSVFVALRFLQTAMTRKNSDRVFQAVLNRQVAQIYARLGQLRVAVEKEKETFHIFRITLGNDHEFTKSSKEMLQEYMVAAQAQGKLLAEQEEKQKAEANAKAIADEIIANEIAEEKKKKKKKTKSKAKKKK